MELRHEQLNTLEALFNELGSIAHQASRILQTDAGQRTLFVAYMSALRELQDEAALLVARCLSKAGIVDERKAARLETLGRAASDFEVDHCPTCSSATPPPRATHRPQVCPHRPKSEP